MVTWEQVTQNPKYISLSSSEKEDKRNQYWDEVVAPRVSVDDVAETRLRFDTETAVPIENIQSEVKATKGFMNTIENPITLMKTESIPAHLINYFSTSKEEYDKRNKEDRVSAIHSTPALTSLATTLNDLDDLVVDGSITPEQSKIRDTLLNVYGDLYDKIDKSYDSKSNDFSMEAIWEAFKDDKGGTIATFANALMADPELLLAPMGWRMAAAKGAAMLPKYAKTASAVSGATATATLGASIAAADQASRDLSKTGKVNIENVKLVAKISAVLSPAMVIGGKVAVKATGKLNDMRTDRLADKEIRDTHEKALDYMNRGMGMDNAVSRVFREMRVSDTVRKKLDKRLDTISGGNGFASMLGPKARQAQAIRSVEKSESLIGRAKELGSKAVTKVDRALGAISTRMSNYSPSLGLLMKRLDLEEGLNVQRGLLLKDDLKKHFKKLNKPGRALFELHWNNNDIDSLKDLFINNPKATESIDNLRTELDDMFNRSEKVQMDVGHVSSYLPRSVIDYKKYLKRRGITVDNVRDKLITYINKKFKLDSYDEYTKYNSKYDDLIKLIPDEEVVKVINETVLRFKGSSTIDSATNSMAPRTVRETLVTKDLVDYNNWDVSLTHYMTGMNKKLSSREFLRDSLTPKVKGVKIPTEEDVVHSSISQVIAKLKANGEILAEDMGEMELMLRARLVGAGVKPNKLIAGAKNLMYASLLGNPAAAMTQLGDLAAATYIAGAANTALALPEVIARRSTFKMEDVGLTALAHEYENLGATAKLLDAALYLGGFKAIDTLGKEVLMNASLKKLQGMIQTKEGLYAIKKKYGDALTPEEQSGMFRAIKDGDKNNFALKFMLYHELTRAQPIGLSEMPAYYLQNPNMRVFYMLKTFTIKQLDAVRREAYNEIKKGNVAKGVKNLIVYSTILGAGNTSVQVTKSWIRGEEIEYTDAMMVNTFKNYGLAPHYVDEIKKGNIITGTLGLAMPPVKVGDDFIKALMGQRDWYKTLKTVPPFGEALSLLLYGQQE